MQHYEGRHRQGSGPEFPRSHRANVAYDAYVKVTKEGGKDVDRTLYGIHDLSEAITLTVTAQMTGRTKDYTITAKYEK